MYRRFFHEDVPFSAAGLHTGSLSQHAQKLFTSMIGELVDVYMQTHDVFVYEEFSFFLKAVCHKAVKDKGELVIMQSEATEQGASLFSQLKSATNQLWEQFSDTFRKSCSEEPNYIMGDREVQSMMSHSSLVDQVCTVEEMHLAMFSIMKAIASKSLTGRDMHRHDGAADQPASPTRDSHLERFLGSLSSHDHVASLDPNDEGVKRMSDAEAPGGQMAIFFGTDAGADEAFHASGSPPPLQEPRPGSPSNACAKLRDDIPLPPRCAPPDLQQKPNPLADDFAGTAVDGSAFESSFFVPPKHRCVPALDAVRQMQVDELVVEVAGPVSFQDDAEPSWHPPDTVMSKVAKSTSAAVGKRASMAGAVVEAYFQVAAPAIPRSAHNRCCESPPGAPLASMASLVELQSNGVEAIDQTEETVLHKCGSHQVPPWQEELTQIDSKELKEAAVSLRGETADMSTCASDAAPSLRPMDSHRDRQHTFAGDAAPLPSTYHQE